MLSEWAVMAAKDGVALNYYGPGSITTILPSGTSLTIIQDTDYPLSGMVKMTITPETKERFILNLRIPTWSRENHLTVNGRDAGVPSSGSYFSLDRQ